MSDEQTPTVSDPWAYFECNLECCVHALEPDEILIIARRTANQYVQLFHKGDHIFVEAASNAYIEPPPFLLSRRRYRRALDLGWMPPTITAEQHDANQEARALGIDTPAPERLDLIDSPNFHTIFPVGAPRLPWFLIQTLHLVYGIKGPDELQYRSFTADGSFQIKWPILFIERDPT